MAKKLNKLGVENSLWNNIRANKGSGKAPTKEMLKQERKINAKYPDGGLINQPNNGPRNSLMASGNFETNPNMSKYGLNSEFNRAFGKNRNLNLGVNANIGATYNSMPSTQGEFSMPMTPTVEPTANFGATGSYNSGNNNFNANVNYNPYNQGVEGKVTYTKKFGMGGYLPMHGDGDYVGASPIKYPAMNTAVSESSGYNKNFIPVIGAHTMSPEEIAAARQQKIYGSMVAQNQNDAYRKNYDANKTQAFNQPTMRAEGTAKTATPMATAFAKNAHTGWKKRLAAETAATGDKLRVSNKPNVFDDYFNVPSLVGGMASHIGQAPLQSQQTHSAMPWVTALGEPLAAGALSAAIHPMVHKMHVPTTSLVEGAVAGNLVGNAAKLGMNQLVKRGVSAAEHQGLTALKGQIEGGGAHHANGGIVKSRSLRKFAEAGTVATGAGITDYAGYAQMAMPIAHMLMPDQQVKDTRGNVVGNKMDTGYAMGSKALDWGTKGLTLSGGNPFIGAAAGVAGAIVGGFENESNNKKIDKQKLLDNDNIYNEDTSKAFNTNTGNFTQRRSTNTNMSFAAGGQVIDEDMGNPNAELELNETFRDPMTGETGMVDGPSHDNGGIEMSLAEGTQIWSDRLKHNGRTFASLTKPIINKIANIEKGLDTNPNSRFKQNSIKLLNAQLDFFFNVQESDKQQDEMKRTLKKQEGGVVDDMGNYHYADGGIYIKPENRGKFTAYKERTGKTTEEALHSPDPHVRQMANFARNAAGWKHAMGGMVKYDGGGISIGQINPTTGKAYTIEDVQAYNQGETIRPHVPGQLSGDTYTGGNMNFGQANRNFALNNSSGEYGPLNNQSFNQTIKREPANIPETIQGRQLPNYSFNQPINRTIVPTPETVVPNATYARKPNGINYSNPEYRDPNFQMLGTTGRTNLPTTGAGPGGVNPALFNKANYSSGDYYMNHPTPGGSNSAGVTAAYEKQRSNDAADQANMTAEEKSAALRNRIDSFRKRGKIGQGVTAAVSNLTQADRLRSLAAPNKISNVNYLSSMTGPDLVNYGNQRNTIEQGASAVVDKAGRYLGNSGSIMATVNAANLAKQQQLGESYQGQENANAAIMNQALAQKNQASIAQAERNSAIEQENYANKYGYDAMLASGLNANDAITANQMGQMFGNDVSFGNDLERARILGNKYAGKVWNSTDDNTIAANNSQLVESRFGGTIGKYADGGNVYNAKLNAVLNEQSNKNAALMDLEYQQNLNAGNKQFTSKVTGLDYKVLPRSEKDLYAANMWKDTHGAAPTKSQVAATKKAIENKPTSSVKAKTVAQSMQTAWNNDSQNNTQYMDQSNMPSFTAPNAAPAKNETAKMMKNVPTYTPSNAASPDYGNQNTMQYMNQNNMPTNFGPPKLTPNTNTKTIKMNEGLNQNYSDNTRTNLQANKSPKKQDQNIPMLNQKIGKPTIMNQGSDAYNDVRDYAKANETKTNSNIKLDTKNLPNPTEGARMVIETATKNAGKAGKFAVPLPARMLVNDLFNKDKDSRVYTEKEWSKRGLKGLKDAVNTAKKDGRAYLNYADFDGIAGTKQSEESLGDKVLTNINSQIGKYSLGHANFKQKGDSTIITDKYNFNDKNNKNYFSNVKGRLKVGDAAYYAPFRAMGTTWGSEEGKGSNSRVAIYNPETNNTKKKKKS